MRRPVTTTANPDSQGTDRRPAFVRAWDSFFFQAADPTPLGWLRVVVGLLLLWDFAWLGVDLRAWLGPDGWADPAVVRSFLPPGAWSLWLWLPEGGILPVFAAGLVVLVLFTIGLGSRVTAVLAWAFVVSTNRRVPVMLFGFDNIVATWLLYLAACGASGRALSIDQLIARRRGGSSRPAPSVAANLGLRLVQLHLCLIYASAGLAKLQGTPWWDGSAIGMLLGNSEFRTFDQSFLADYPTLLQLATHATVFLEIVYPILIWFRAWRSWMLAGAVLMHLGIATSMGLTEFSLAMAAGNLAFVPTTWLARVGLGRGLGSSSALESAEGPDPTRASSSRGPAGRGPRTEPGRAPR